MINPNKVLREYLLADTALAALVGTNVAYPDLPADTDIAGKMGTAVRAVVFGARGGRSDIETPLLRPSYQVRCWALRPAEAREVYAAVFDALHGKNNLAGTSGKILSAFEEVSPQDVTDDDTGWATVIGFYRLLLPATS